MAAAIPSTPWPTRFGHLPTDPRKKRPGRPNTGRSVRRLEECLVFIRDRPSAYIGWERFEANRKRLAANRNLTGTPGAPHNGPDPRAQALRQLVSELGR